MINEIVFYKASRLNSYWVVLVYNYSQKSCDDFGWLPYASYAGYIAGIFAAKRLLNRNERFLPEESVMLPVYPHSEIISVTKILPNA